MITVEEIRQSMRVCHTDLDEEIERNIMACQLDLERVGIDTTKDTALMDKARELYCKWQYDYEGKAEHYNRAYDNLRNAMSLCGEYAEESR